MTKKDLVAAIAKEADLTIKDAGKALNAFVASVGKAMKEGERLQLPGLGTFKVAQRSARVVRNPRTGEKLNVPAKKVVKFKAAPALEKNWIFNEIVWGVLCTLFSPPTCISTFLQDGMKKVLKIENYINCFFLFLIYIF